MKTDFDFRHPNVPELSVSRSLVFALLAVALAAVSQAQQPDPRYWRLDDIAAQFDAWQTQYPAIFQQTTLGLSGQREPILMARISDHADISEPDEPGILFHAAQHANECNGTGAIMRQMATLLEGYGNDPAVTARVDSLELWFVPVFNPDGHRYVFSGEPSWADWRKTLRDNNQNGMVDFPQDGVDLDRNWDWYWNEYDGTDPASQKYRGPSPWSESEIVALRDFVLTERPLVVVDYHSPVTISWHSYIFYPWVSTHGGSIAPDYYVARSVAENWAAQTRNEDNNPYNTIFGYDTLPKEQNWLYGRAGTLCYIMEIADHCWWADAVVDTIATRVARGSVALLDRVIAGPGIKGTVSDAVTGQPLAAEVEIAQLHDPNLGPHLTDARFGEYQRITAADAYTVTAHCAGYTDDSVAVSVADASWAIVDFALQPDATGVGDTAAPGSWLRVGDTIDGSHTVALSLPAGRPAASVAVFDLRGLRVADLGHGLAAGRRHALQLPTALASGVYLVQARSGPDQAVARIVIVR